MMLEYFVDITRTSHEYKRDINFTHKSEVSDAIINENRDCGCPRCWPKN